MRAATALPILYDPRKDGANCSACVLGPDSPFIREVEIAEATMESKAKRRQAEGAETISHWRPVPTEFNPGAAALIVGEAPERGKGIYSSGTIENTYAVDEQVPTIAPYRGCEVLVLLTSGQNITRGGLLEVAATGKCIAHAGSFLPAYRALETLAPSQDALIWAQRL